MLSALRGCKYFFCHRPSLFAAQVFYHTYVSKRQGQASLLFLLYTMNLMLVHISAITLTSSSSDTPSSLQVGSHKLSFTIAREQAACKCFQKHHLVLRLQVVTPACYFSVLLKSSKGWKGRICGQGPNVLPAVILLRKSHRHSKRSWKKGKPPAIRKYSDSNPETSGRPTPQPRELHKCPFKMG